MDLLTETLLNNNFTVKIEEINGKKVTCFVAENGQKLFKACLEKPDKNKAILDAISLCRMILHDGLKENSIMKTTQHALNVLGFVKLHNPDIAEQFYELVMDIIETKR